MTEREYWAQRKGQLALDTEAAAQGKPPTKFETDKAKLRRTIRAALSEATSFDEFSSLLLREGVTVKESRGRLSYLTPAAFSFIGMERMAAQGITGWTSSCSYDGSY